LGIEIFQITAFALLSAFGALARQLHIKDDSGPDPTLRSIISGCIIAAFTGTIIYFIADSISIINTNLGYAVSGISGWMGPIVLERLGHFVMDKAGLGSVVDEGKEK